MRIMCHVDINRINNYRFQQKYRSYFLILIHTLSSIPCIYVTYVPCCIRKKEFIQRNKKELVVYYYYYYSAQGTVGIKEGGKKLKLKETIIILNLVPCLALIPGINSFCRHLRGIGAQQRE